jgi:TPR repeat protein
MVKRAFIPLLVCSAIAAQTLADVRKLADAGSLDAQFAMGGYYENGQGGAPQNYPEAMRWDRRAADKGHAPSMVNLGYMYGHGEGVPPDLAEMRRWYLKAADKNHPSAQANLGYMYAHGQGVPQDFTEAAK